MQSVNERLSAVRGKGQSIWTIESQYEGAKTLSRSKAAQEKRPRTAARNGKNCEDLADSRLLKGKLVELESAQFKTNFETAAVPSRTKEPPLAIASDVTSLTFTDYQN